MVKFGSREWTYNSTNDAKSLPNSDTFRGTRNHGFTFRRQIWWKTAVGKLPKSHLAKTPAARILTKPPILLSPGRSHPKFPERCRPLTCAPTPNLLQISCGMPELLAKDQFFWPPVTTISTGRLWSTMYKINRCIMYITSCKGVRIPTNIVIV